MSLHEYLENTLKSGVVGICGFFDIKPFLDAANQLVAADEPLRALNLINNLPGYYRDNEPHEITELRKAIHRLLATPHFYVHNKHDWKINVDDAKVCINGLLRGQQILNDVRYYNSKGISPHIVEYGPGEYWLPIGLWQSQCMFTYYDIGLSAKAKELAEPHIKQFYLEQAPKDRPHMFIACEIIEHLHYEQDLLAEYMKAGCDAEIIHLSTPLYTFDGRKERLHWREFGDLGHLRTYTPKEFYDTVSKMFKEHEFELLVSNIMHLRGVRKDLQTKIPRIQLST